MNFLLIFASVQIALIICWWSFARSFLDIGRLRGIEEATRELMRGVASHYELEGDVAPAPVVKAVDGLRALSKKRRKQVRGSTDPHHAQLWIVGDAIGEACWFKGHAAGVRRKAPAEGKIRIDLSLAELIQLSWLAHLGFRHMMPNYRGFEIHRFNGEQDAREGAKAVAKIESIIPAADRPFADLLAQYKGREKLISDWWHATPNRLMA